MQILTRGRWVLVSPPSQCERKRLFGVRAPTPAHRVLNSALASRRKAVLSRGRRALIGFLLIHWVFSWFFFRTVLASSLQYGGDFCFLASDYPVYRIRPGHRYFSVGHRSSIAVIRIHAVRHFSRPQTLFPRAREWGDATAHTDPLARERAPVPPGTPLPLDLKRRPKLSTSCPRHAHPLGLPA